MKDEAASQDLPLGEFQFAQMVRWSGNHPSRFPTFHEVHNHLGHGCTHDRVVTLNESCGDEFEVALDSDSRAYPGRFAKEPRS